jgi:hypothetical protein
MVTMADPAAAATGTVSVSHPRFETRSVEWTGAGDRLRVALGSPLVRAILAIADTTAVNAFMLGWWDMPTVVDELHGRGLSVIVRIVASRTPSPVRRYRASRPARRRVPRCRAAGADEVQFDYVRFPDGSKVGVFFDEGSGTSESVRTEAIRSFLAEARALLPAECRVAADIFGFTVPANHPGPVVTASMTDAADRVGSSTTLRPWLQDSAWGGWSGILP